MKHALLYSTITLATTLAVVVASNMPVNAQRYAQYPWCSRYFDSGAAETCAFNTHSQCMQTVNGIGGYCYRNPYFRGGRGRY
jgi:Protein of unknown function (DUF3551)